MSHIITYTMSLESNMVLMDCLGNHIKLVTSVIRNMT